MKWLLRSNVLSLVVLGLLLPFWAAQLVAGWLVVVGEAVTASARSLDRNRKPSAAS